MTDKRGMPAKRRRQDRGKSGGSKAPPAIVQAAPAQLPAGPDGGPANGYAELLAELKTRIRTARIRAGVAVNRELVLLYWHMGRQILNRQSREGWGAKVIDRLSADLRREFPEMSGFSPRNLKYMRPGPSDRESILRAPGPGPDEFRPHAAGSPI